MVRLVATSNTQTSQRMIDGIVFVYVFSRLPRRREVRSDPYHRARTPTAPTGSWARSGAWRRY
jgi:hypothetical protein